MGDEDELAATGHAPPRRRRWPLALGVAAVVLVAAVGGFLWWFFADDAPDEVDLAATVDQLAADPSTADASAAGPDATSGADATAQPPGAVAPATPGSDDARSEEAPTPATADDPSPGPSAGDDPAAQDVAAGVVGDGIDGTWMVDTNLGTFDLSDSSTGSYVGFRIDEELRGIGATEAVGRTGSVEGTFIIADQTLRSADVTADLSDLATDDSRRDDRARGALNVDEQPAATFRLVAPVELGEVAALGEPVDALAAGELTVNGVTQPVEVDLDAQLVEDVVVVTGTTTILLSDFDVEVPSAPVVVSASDEATVELQLLFTRAG